MTICMKSDYDAWQKDEMLYCQYESPNFLSVEEGRKKNVKKFQDYDGISEEDIKLYLEGEKSLSDLGFEDIDDFYHTALEDEDTWENRYLENFGETFKTPSGEEVYAFGWYGHDQCMKLQIRQGVFETNSSSTHAVCIMTDDEYKQFKQGEILIDRYGDIMPKKEYEDRVKAEKQETLSKAKSTWEKYYKHGEGITSLSKTMKSA